METQEPGKTPSRHYAVFISYRHADNKEPGRQWATWLHQALEGYEIPADLVETRNNKGELIPASLYPVFRDEEELPADADLTRTIRQALENSGLLVVLASPRAVESPFVAEEIRYFKALGKADRILALMIDGEPNASDDSGKARPGIEPAMECLPRPLRYGVAQADGRIDWDARTAPIAADVRPEGRPEQGWTTGAAYREALHRAGGLEKREIERRGREYEQRLELAKLKVVAGAMGVPLGVLTERDKAYQLKKQKQRAKVLRRWLAAVGLLAMAAVTASFFAVLKQREAEYQRDQTMQAHLRLLTDTASVRLRDRDVRTAQGIILEVLSHRLAEGAIGADEAAIFQEARAADLQLIGLAGHGGAVHSASWSPGGTRVVTASADGTARIWDVATGAELVSLAGHGQAVRSAAWSPDSTRIVTASADKTARIWDAGSGAELAVLSGHGDALNDAAFSPDGKWIVTASEDGAACVWDAATFRKRNVLAGHEGSVASAAWSPDGLRIVTASADKTARTWDATSGKALAKMSGHTENVLSASFSPDGARVVTASQDKTARVWDAATGAPKGLLNGHLGRVHSAVYSPDGRYIITASFDRTARIWEADTSAPFRVLSGHLGELFSAAYSPDARHVVTASADRTARIWHATAPGQLAVLSGHRGLVTSSAWSPDGKRILTTSADRTARVWDASSTALLGVLTGHQELVNSVESSPDGRRLVTASYDNTAAVWDAMTFKEILRLKGHGNLVTAAVYSPDGARIATGSFDKTVALWDANTGARLAVLAGHEGTVRSVVFSPDGRRLLTASDDGSARLWDAVAGTALGVLARHEATVRTAAFSPDGRRIVTSAEDRTARIWDAATATQLVVLRGHGDVLRCAVFSPDGRQVVTASYDSTARIWDAATATQLAVLPVHGDGVRSAVYSPDGARIVTSSLDGNAYLWDAQVPAGLEAQIAWMAAAAFDPLVDQERTQLGLPPIPRARRAPAGTPICDDAAALKAGDAGGAIPLYEEAWRRGELRAAFELGQIYEGAPAPDLPRAWSWYEKGAGAGEPNALARFAQRSESSALAEAASRKNALLLKAFESYALAALRADAETWPEEAFKSWRFRRATLARLLAREGMMEQVAGSETRVHSR